MNFISNFKEKNKSIPINLYLNYMIFKTELVIRIQQFKGYLITK